MSTSKLCSPRAGSICRPRWRARAIYGSQFNPQITLKALSYFDDGDLPRLPQALKDRLARAVSAVDLDRLPVVTARREDRT